MTALYIIGALLWGGSVFVLLLFDGERSRFAAIPMILVGILVWSVGVSIEASEHGRRIGAAEGYRDGVYACRGGSAVLDTLSNGSVVITEIRDSLGPVQTSAGTARSAEP